MSVDPTGVGHPVPAVLVSLDAGLDRAGDAALFGLSDAELLAAVEESERLAARLAGLQARLVAELDGRGLSAETLRRLACDATITSVLTDGHRVPLDVGRQQRTITPGLWAALVVRDRGCVFPGCTRPVAWCEAHHIRAWADGGETKLANLALLCGHHHQTVHHEGWQIRLTDHRHPELIPPPWVDPDRTPQRNPYWRLRDHLPPPGGP
jgi:hypothetical protein